MIPLRGLEVKEKERQTQKLIGLISKTDILNVAREREEFEKAVEKLGSSSEHHSTSVSNNTERTNTSSAPSAYKLNVISRQRFLFLAFGMIIFIIVYSVGAIFVKININEAEIIKRHFQQELAFEDYMNGFLNKAFYIYLYLLFIL